MNWDTMAGNWKQMKGKARQKWAKLTDDDLTYIDGKREQLLGRIQERYGIQKDIAERELKDWERTLYGGAIGKRRMPSRRHPPPPLPSGICG